MRTGIGSRRLGFGLAAARILVALAMVGALGVVAVRGATAQVDGSTFTAQTYDWSITWDDGTWEVREEINDDGFDRVVLFSPSVGAAFIEGYTGFDGDPAACLEAAIAAIEEDPEVNDFVEADDLDTPRAPSDAEGTAYTYAVETDDGEQLAVVEYTECRPLVEGEAVLELTYQTLLIAYEDGLPIFEELLQGLDVGETGTIGDDGDEEGEDTQPADDEDEATGAEGEDQDEDEADGAGQAAESGIGEGEYESPTYGYTLEWDEEVWEINPSYEERINVSDDTAEGLDGFSLTSEVGALFFEGKVAYAGDPELCLEGEAELLANEPGVEAFAPAEDEDGQPITGETEVGAVFGIYEVLVVDEEGVEFEVLDYVECRELIAGEAVLVITYVTSLAEEFDDNVADVVEPVLETIELDGGSVPDDEDATEEAEDEETEEAEAPEDEPTEEAEEDEEETTGGVSGNTYESPTYGYALEWDDAVWTVDDESSSGGVDMLVLSSDFGIATFVASDEYGGDQSFCYLDLEASFTGDFPDLTVLEPQGQEPLRGSDETGEFGFYSADDGSLFVFLRCSPIVEDESTLAISFAGPTASAADAVTGLLALLAGLELS